MPYKDDCWYCYKCDFYVFNSKSECSKCMMPKPELKPGKPNVIRPYLSEEEKKEFDEYFSACAYRSSFCNKCWAMKETDPSYIPQHNCWKYM